MNRTLLLGLMTLLLLATHADAAKSNWQFLFDQETAKFYFDTANIEGEGPEKQFWLKILKEINKSHE